MTSSVTYLDLRFGHVLRHVADNNLAGSGSSRGLGRRRLLDGAAGSPGVLVDATDWGSGSRAASRATGSTAAATGSAALRRDDLVERLVKLSGRHCVWEWRMLS